MILSFADQQLIKKLSANNEAKYAQIAGEVEEQLAPLLGLAFLQDVQDNPENYTTLLSGDTYTDPCTKMSVKHRGLNYVLAYLNYEAYVNDSSVADTFTGFVQKQHSNAQPIDAGTRSSLRRMARNLAFAEWEKIRTYISINKANYPLYVVPGRIAAV